MAPFLFAGLAMGLSAGFAPGPMLSLLLNQTLRHGTREGLKIACCPLLTDAPIIAASLLLTREAEAFGGWLGVVSLAGSVLVLYLAWKSFTALAPAPSGSPEAPHSILKGVAVNVLNPNPYLFWLTIGAPTFLKAWAVGPAAAIGFVAVFYGLLVGVKAALAWTVGRSRRFLGPRVYRTIMIGIGGLLVVFAGMLVRDGLRALL